ncbi:MAG: SRPBCC family protein [Cyclobacteriaceae bacterium]
MPVISFKTRINAPKEVCFDLCRSIDLHKVSTSHTNEEAIRGVVSGLIDLGETVTWRAKHLGFYQRLTSVITEYERPDLFVDELEKGIFSHFRHEHRFANDGEFTLMTDVFDYRSPLGILGKLADKLFLKAYMTDLLDRRNKTIKSFAENGKWQEIVKIPKSTIY